MTEARIRISDEEIDREAWERLMHVYDPEIGIDLVNLGLIYDVRVRDGDVHVEMSLTTPGCPMSDTLPQAVERALSTVAGAGRVTVDLVFEPRWDPDRMSYEAKRQLGFF